MAVMSKLVLLTFSAKAYGGNVSSPRQLGGVDVVEDVCKSIGNNLCGTSLRFPTGATMTYKQSCTARVCTWSCGQESCTYNCCSWTSKACTYKCCCWGFLKCGCSKRCGELCVNKPEFGCSRQRCGETCVDIPCSGRSRKHCGEICANVPEALRIDWKDASPCDHFGVGQLVQAAEKMCSCLGTLKGFLDYAAEFDAEPSGKALAAASEMLSCLVKNGFNVQSNKPAVVHKLTSGDDYVLQAPPVDLALYSSMSAAVAACVGGACHLIHQVLLGYFKSAAKDVTEGLKSFLQSLVLSLVGPLAAASEVPRMLAEDLNSTLQCKAQEAEDAFKKLQQKIEDVKTYFAGFKSKVESIQNQLQKTLRALDGVLDAADNSVTAVVEHLQKGKVPLVDAVKQIADLQEVKELLEALETLKAEAQQVKTRAEQLDSLKIQLKDLAMSDDCGLSELLADLKEIPSLKDMVAAQSQMIDALDLNANSLQVGIVSYKQWVDISMELPCSKMERWEYSLLGLTVSADYPKFYPCDFNYNLPLPNEHIPYLRLKNAAKALAV